jgi:hypothetical protein
MEEEDEELHSAKPVVSDNVLSSDSLKDSVAYGLINDLEKLNQVSMQLHFNSIYCLS